MKFIHTADIHLDSPLSGLAAYMDAPADSNQWGRPLVGPCQANKQPRGGASRQSFYFSHSLRNR